MRLRDVITSATPASGGTVPLSRASQNVQAAARLNEHHKDFLALIDTARSYLSRGSLDAAATYAQIAGQFAWMNHTGLFASVELEALLTQIGARCGTPAQPRRPRREPGSVLHVMTRSYHTGGHTRAVMCWMAEDVGRRHRLCLTRQGLTPPPTTLVSQLDKPSDLVRLDARRGLLLSRAATLRKLAEDCDVVVLHTHPYDVVPLLAFAAAGRPPVIYANHADHVFWLGVGVSDLILNMRDSGQLLATTRRGVDPDRAVVFSWPLMTRHRDLSREDAKRRLGLRPNQVLLITAADASKYRPLTRPGFLDMVLPVLQRHEEAVLIAAGPRPEGEWLHASGETGGRIRAMGPLPDVTPLQLAADIYLDSFPFSSGTSLLEAGSFGTPAITYRGHPATCDVLGVDARSLDGHLVCASDPETFQKALSHAITDPAWRVEVGARTQRAILDRHTGTGWRAAVADAYCLAAQLEGPHAVIPIARQTSELDIRVDAIMTLTGYSEGFRGAVRDHLALLPIAARIEAARTLLRLGRRPPLRYVLPEWVLARLVSWRGAARARRAMRRLTQASGLFRRPADHPTPSEPDHDGRLRPHVPTAPALRDRPGRHAPQRAGHR